MSDNVFIPKMRIQLLNEDGTIKSDRLVNQKIELTTGPKEGHKGSTRFEITFQDKSDISDFFKYLETLQTDLPEREVNARGRKPSEGTTSNLASPREDILTEVEKMAKDNKSHSDIIKYLRQLGFVFLLTEDFKMYFPDFPFEPDDIGEPNNNGQYPNKIVWMARCIKISKTNPKMDKFENMILFGFQVMNKKAKVKIVPYLYRERKQVINIAIADGNKNAFSMVKEFTKFPIYMLEEERLKFQAEYRLLSANPDKEPSKFFIRWSPEVNLSKEVYSKLKHLVEGGKCKFKNNEKTQ